MPFEISASVGDGGANRPHDIARLQAAFTHLRFEGKKHVIDGRLNFFGPSIKNYIIANPIRKGGATSYSDKIEPKGPVIEALRKALRGSTIEKLAAIWGTPILYEPVMETGFLRPSSDFLIPPFLSLPRVFRSGKINYSGRIESVEFIQQPVTQNRFDVAMSLGGVGRFLDPKTHTLTKKPPAAFRSFIEQELKHTGKNWSYVASTSSGSHFHLRSRDVVEVGRQIRALGPGSANQRVVWNDLKTAYKIPARDRLLEVAGRIHAEACASTGKQGGRVINKSLASYAATVLEKGLNPYTVAGQERACASCRTLADTILLAREQMTALRKRQDDRFRYLTGYIISESGDAEVERAQKILKIVGSNLIPVPGLGDKIFGVDLDQEQQFLTSKKDLVGYAVKLKLKWGEDSEYFKALSRFLKVADVFLAAAAIGNLTGALIRQAFNKEKIRQETLRVQRQMYNLQLEYEEAELREKRALRDHDARGCEAWGHLHRR